MGWQDHAPAAGGAGGAGDGSRSWRQPSSGQPVPEPRRTSLVTKARGKQFFASSLAVGCAIVFIWLVMLFIKGCDSTTLFVTAHDGDKAGPIPPNWMGDADLKKLESLAQSGRVRKLKVTSFNNELEFQKPLKDLFSDKDLAEKKDTACVIYLSGHAVVETILDDPSKNSVAVADADVLLLTKNDDFGSKSNRLRLSQILSALRQLPKEQRKLLLLDLGRLQGRWRLGVYDNFVVEAVQAAVQREKIQNLFVMTACSSGEASWVSPHLGESGQSLFAHFVARGLSGEADGANGKSDGSVTVSELFRFVHTRVNDWVERNRDPAGQHPRLFAGEADIEKQVVEAKKDATFSVASINSRVRAEAKEKGQTKAVSSDAIDKTIDQLLGLWKRRQALEQPARSANAIYHLDPVGFRALTHRLMRAEEFLIHRHADDASKELKEAETLCQKLELHAKQGHFAVANFQPNESFPRRLADRFGLGAAPRNEGTATSPAAPDASLLALPDDHLAIVLSRAHKQYSMPTVIKDSESIAVQKSLVELRQLAEGVAFGHHTVLPWLRQELRDADHLRRRAEDSFFVADTAAARQKRDKPKKGEAAVTTDQSADKAQEVRQLITEATESFGRLREKASVLEAAQFALNRSCATLPEWLAFVSDRSTDDELRQTRLEIMNQYHEPLGIRKNEVPKSDILANVGLTAKDARSVSLNQLDREILSSALEAIELRRLLPTHLSLIDAEQMLLLDKTTKNLVGSLNSVQQRFQKEADNLRNTSQPQPSHWRLFRDLLRCSTLDPEVRRDLFGKLIHLRLTEDTNQNNTIKMPEPNDHQTANWQMLCSIHALSLVPAPTSLASDKLWNEWHDVSIRDSRIEPEPVIKLSRNLRKHWIGHLGEARAECRASQLETRESARKSLEQKDLSARILFSSDAINLQEDPTRRFEQFLIAELLLDSTERYLDDFWDQWYAEAAKICFDTSSRLGGKLLLEERNRVESQIAARGASSLQLEAASVWFGTQPTATGSVRVQSGSNLPRGLATTWLAFKEGDPRASKTRPLADRCTPHSVGLEVARNGNSNDVNTFVIAQPDVQALTTTSGCKPSQVVPQIFFRDHTWSVKQKPALFNPCRPDGTLIRQLAASNTGAIRVTGEDRKSVVFVLDASGSMLKEVNEQEDRWKPAKEVLLGVLREMEANNRNSKAEPHQVSLIVYGHRDSANRDNFSFVKTEVSMSPLTVNLIKDVEKKLEGFEPFGTTPLLTAAKRACESLSEAKIPGTVIVITDGAPNDGAKLNAQKTEYEYEDSRTIVMPKLQREIEQALDETRVQHREVELQVIGINLGTPPTGTLTKKQQETLDNEKHAIEALEKFIDKANGRKGKFRIVKGFDALKGALNITTAARHFFVGDPTQSSIAPQDGPLNEALKLPVGNYRVAFGEADRLASGHTVRVRGDELLDFQLRADGSLEHIHPQVLNAPVAFRETMDKRRFEMGYLQSFSKPGSQATFLIGIQNRSSGSNGQISYTERPDRLIVEILPKGEPLEKLLPITYKIEPGKSDPTWNIQVDDWPQQVADAEIRAYANWDPVPPDVLLESTTVAQSVSVPINKTDKVAFQVEIETPDNDRVDLDDSVQVKLRLNPSDAEQFEKDWRHLAYLHVQLQLDGKPISHLNETAEVIATVNEIRWKFSNLPKEGFSAKQLRIAVTSWHTYQLQSRSLQKPLLIKAE